ncbi:MAG: hypothetical protein IH586_23365 [Anaerolineaceae bacterium]|nr:hypothetical protein [Anaerolineaceae bacterium]
MNRHTSVTIQGEKFFINGSPTYPGQVWNGCRIEGLLINSRMVQAIFDDLNPETRPKWDYPGGQEWDPERNVREFIEMLPQYSAHGVLAFTVNLQGGSPQGYSREQPWHNSAITAEGDLRADYMARLERVIDRADELGMVVILGIFYFGQEMRLKDEASIQRAVDQTVDWVMDHGYTNVIIEVNNECNILYTHPILQPERVHELIERVKARTRGDKRILAGTSYGGNFVPLPNVVKCSDFLLMHGNGVEEPQRIAEMCLQVRQVEGYRPMPILFNEDDHFRFDQPVNNFVAAIREYVSWGFFDYRMQGEGFDDGYQSVPVNWGISSKRKQGFFRLAKEISGYL